MKAGETLVVLCESRPLIILYTDRLKWVKEFYELLGLKFQEKQDDQGLEHFVCDLGGVVLEIHSVNGSDMSKNPRTRTPHVSEVRIALKADLELIARLVCDGDVNAFRDESQADMKEMVLTQDPEGRWVELRLI